MKTPRKGKMIVKSAVVCLLYVLLFVESQQSLPAHAAAQPVNANASQEVRSLLSYLSGISGKQMITGQHDYLESPDELNNKLKSLSGSYAGLHGYELGAVSNQNAQTTARQRNQVIASAIQWDRKGGIVAMTFHQSLPGTARTWKNVQSKLSQEQFNKYVTPGTQEYNKLIADLDDAAVYLKKLRDAKVPVLWRPYHEMNADWFWWGKKENFAQLWNIMYDRFVNVHQLNNLIWVWNPNAPDEHSGPYAPTFPGLAKVDILAADIYDNDFQDSYYRNLLFLAGGKPIAIGENGDVPSAEVLERQPKWVYAMTFGKLLTEQNSTDEIKTYMNAKKTLTLPELVKDREASSK
ncbi:glycosyl hydrolase [Paenibacillus zeirhizosphaerae]|uniref:glycosyl hydrolase n=1 Tax=Paenibacillus zeirhizosphaerae TaxID=2987519 RepID=UPI003520A8A2